MHFNYIVKKVIKLVVAITVTYNGSKTLTQTVEALLTQSTAVDWIIIVDNASSDEHLNQIYQIVKLDSRIIHLRLATNTGGAGGFQVGMEYALKKFNPDWYWLMDDDAYPSKTCLENLLHYQQYNNNIGCLVPLIYGSDLNKYQLYHHKKVSKLLTKDIPVAKDVSRLQEITKIDANAFVGPLISKNAVKKLGVADGSLFIYGDDLEYTYRISRQFDILLIKNAIINHRDPLLILEKSNPKGWWKEYYLIRNRILFVHKYQENRLKKILANIIFYSRVKRKQIYALVLPRYKGRRIVRYKILKKAYEDGKNSISGIVIQPLDYYKWLKNRQPDKYL